MRLHNFTNNILHFIILFLTVFSSGLAHAEDTEIYFSNTSSVNEVTRPNLLFILDTSNSMTRTLDGSTRIQILRDVMQEIFDNSTNVNIGLMRFNRGLGGANSSVAEGGSVIFPISNIDASLGDVVGEFDTNSYNNFANADSHQFGTDPAIPNAFSLPLRARTAVTAGTQTLRTNDDNLYIRADADDASQDVSSQVQTTGALELSSNSLFIGLRFVFEPGLIQRCSTINTGTDTQLRVRRNSTNSVFGNQTVRIFGQSGSTTLPFDGTNIQDITSRPQVMTTPTSNIPLSVDRTWNANNSSLIVSNIQPILQEIVNQGCANPGQGAADENDGTWDESSIVLILQYISGASVEFNSQNAAGTLTNQGSGTNAVGGRLRVSYEAMQRNQALATVALRFEDVDIPQGVTIENSSFCFTMATPVDTGATPDPGDITLEIEMGAQGNALESDLTNLAAVPRTSQRTLNISLPLETRVENGQYCTTATHAPDLTAILNEVVNRADWCGGNAITLFLRATTGSASIQSTERNESATRLNYDYTRSSNDGCWSAQHVNQVDSSSDDAQQDGTGKIEINEMTIPITVQNSGYRFDEVQVDSGTDNIQRARLIFTSGAAVSGGNGRITVRGQLAGNPVGFAEQFNNITDRAMTTASATNIITNVNDTEVVTATLPSNLADGGRFEVDVTTIVQELVNQSGWNYENTMVFLVSPQGTPDASYRVRTTEGDLSNAARLRIDYENTGLTNFGNMNPSIVLKTVRERLGEIVDEIIVAGSTPIQEALYEAAHYWRGEPVVYGSNRYDNSTNRVSHPGTYCNGASDCPGVTATPNVRSTETIDGTNFNLSLTNEFGVRTAVTTGTICNPLLANDTDCGMQEIVGNPTYLSPFADNGSAAENMCARNFQILLTDGQQNDFSSTATADLISEYGSLFTNPTCYVRTLDFNPDIPNVTYSNFLQDGPGGRQERCMVDLAEMLNMQDQNSTIAGNQTVSTYTVAFDQGGTGGQNARRILRDIASQGGGEFYEANNAEQLATAFNEILFNVRNESTSFSAPSLATNAFNRLLSRDEIYFGLFQPSMNVFWTGNVKKYGICISSADGCTLGSILDANNAVATGSDNRFLDNARSHWSDVADGSQTTVGGAGAEISEHHQGNSIGTKIYTDIGGANGTVLNLGNSFEQPGYVYQESNNTTNDWIANDLQYLRSRICGFIPGTDPDPAGLATNDPIYVNCRNRMQWLLGRLSTPSADMPSTDIDENQRWSVADVLHSSPTVITYGGRDTDADGETDVFYEKLLYTTNDGSLHMVNPSDTSGREEWRYIPSELLSQQTILYDNVQSNHLYGLDSTPVFNRRDTNRNGIIETADGDTVHIYFGMRRGGNNLYALDISATMSSANTLVTPSFLWKILGGATPGFARLAQTWSRPTVAMIQTTTGPREVLIFGGGYDTRLDTGNRFGTAASGGANNMGNAIYIVDAATGIKILSISGDADGDNNNNNNILVTDMRHAIPSEITVLDSDGNGLSDRIYFGDTGGNVWRVDIGADIAFSTSSTSVGGGTSVTTGSLTAPPLGTTIGLLATIADTSMPTGYRRFFERPSVIQVSDSQFATDSEYDYVLIGTGYRAHPLETSAADRFYAFRDFYTGKMSQRANSNLALSYPNGLEIAINHNTPGHLIDVSNRTLEQIAGGGGTDLARVQGALGWYLDFNTINASSTSGEKVLSAPVVLGGTLGFTTYVPDDGSTPPPNEPPSCTSAQIGSGRAYNLNVLTTSASLDWDADGNLNPVADRRRALGGGIPSNIIPVFTKEGVIGIVNYDNSSEAIGKFAELPRFKTYWYNEL